MHLQFLGRPAGGRINEIISSKGSRVLGSQGHRIDYILRSAVAFLNTAQLILASSCSAWVFCGSSFRGLGWELPPLCYSWIIFTIRFYSI